MRPTPATPTVDDPGAVEAPEAEPDEPPEPIGEAEGRGADDALSVAHDVRDAIDGLARFAGAQTLILAAASVAAVVEP